MPPALSRVNLCQHAFDELLWAASIGKATSEISKVPLTNKMTPKSKSSPARPTDAASIKGKKLLIKDGGWGLMELILQLILLQQ